jgi:geranylgeranyl diphosphate synthase type II
VYGISDSKRIQNQLIDQAIGFLDTFDDRADPLREIARYIIRRNA